MRLLEVGAAIVCPWALEDHGWQQLLGLFRRHAAAVTAAPRKLALDVDLPTTWVTPDIWMKITAVSFRLGLGN